MDLAMAKPLRVRRPSLRVSPKGKVSITSPSVRVGGRRSGVNISRRGVSSTIGTPLGSYNTKRGCRMTFLMVIVVVVMMVTLLARIG